MFISKVQYGNQIFETHQTFDMKDIPGYEPLHHDNC